jgi:hypothetical protein
MHAADEGLVETLAVEILDYLASRPLAADSVEGVARWWLKPARAGVSLGQVERALGLLVSRGRMRRLSLEDGTVLYSPLLPGDRQ